MAVNEATILAVEAQAAELGALLDDVTRAMSDTWGKAWREGAQILAAWSDAWVEVAEASVHAGPRTAILRRANLEAAIRQIEAVLAATMTDGRAAALTPLRDLVERAGADQAALVRTQFPYTMSARAWLPTDPRALAAIIRRTTQQITVRTYYLQRDAARAVRQALRVGMAAGDNPRRVAAAMIRRAEGVFNGGRNRADVIARTELLDAYRTASFDGWQRNASLLVGWRWFADLSSRTCPSCVEQHGSLHPVTEPGPIDHHRGRCTGVPELRPWSELGFKGTPAAPALREGDGHRWFKTLPEADQRAILGPTRFDAWKAGDYPAGSWSHRVESEDWRPAMHTTPAPR